MSERWQGCGAPSAALAASAGVAGYAIPLVNTSRWAYALNLSTLHFVESDGRLPEIPWDRAMTHPKAALLGVNTIAPVVAFVEARFVPEWEAYARNINPAMSGLSVPCGPLNETRTTGPPQTLILQPFGATQLRITEWPVLEGPAQPPGAHQACA